MKCFFLYCALLVSVFLSTGCANFNSLNQRISLPEVRPEVPVGYLKGEAILDSITLLPPPPSAGSMAMALDEEVNQKYFALRDTLRWELAAMDADLKFPQAAGTFSCALNAPITENDTPHIYMLLRRSMTDVGNSTSKAKIKYNRMRPFVINMKPSCTPNDERFLMKNGSYPSGHSAIGWAWAPS